MKPLNDTQKTLMQNFAKTAKISHAKLEGLVNDLFAAFPPSAHKGRQASAETIQLVADIKAVAESNIMDKFTLKDLAIRVHANPSNVTNVVKKLAQEGKAFLVGASVKQQGVRGKTPMLWSFSAPAERPAERPANVSEEPSHE